MLTAAKLYHSSPCGAISSFRPFSHFGTKASAFDRADVRASKADEITPFWMYEVNVDVGHAFDMPDLKRTAWTSAHHSPLRLAEILEGCGVITSGELDEVRRLEDFADTEGLEDFEWPEAKAFIEEYSATGVHPALRSLRAALARAGVDCPRYKNAFEDAGSMSLCVPDPNRVKIVGPPTVIAGLWYPRGTWLRTPTIIEGGPVEVLVTPWDRGLAEKLGELGECVISIRDAAARNPVLEWASRLSADLGRPVQLTASSGPTGDDYARRWVPQAVRVLNVDAGSDTARVSTISQDLALLKFEGSEYVREAWKMADVIAERSRNADQDPDPEDALAPSSAM